MEIHTFHVRNIREGLERIKNELGPNAVIVSTKRVPNGSGENTLEIAAAAEIDATRKRSWFRSTPRTPETSYSAPQKGTGNDASEEGAIGTQELLGMMHELQKTVTSLSEEISQMHSELRQMGIQQRMSPDKEQQRAARNTAQDTSSREAFRLGLSRLWDQSDSQLMRSIVSLHKALLAQGILEEDAEELIAAILADDRQEEIDVSELILEHMSDSIITTDPLWRPTRSGCVDVHVLIGPSGCGKTTTLAKIAAHARYIAQQNVGIIGADAFRIGGTFQLETYGELLDIPVTSIASIPQLRDTVDVMQPCEVVLVDTTGYNLWDDAPEQCIGIDKFHQTYAEDDVEHQVHLHLVLSANTHTSDALELLDRVKHLPITSLIFTKIDEARNLGALYSIAKASGLPISLLSDGRGVPGDVHLPDAEELAHWIVRGYRGRVLAETEAYTLEE